MAHLMDDARDVSWRVCSVQCVDHFRRQALRRRDVSISRCLSHYRCFCPAGEPRFAGVPTIELTVELLMKLEQLGDRPTHQIGNRHMMPGTGQVLGKEEHKKDGDGDGASLLLGLHSLQFQAYAGDERL